MKDRNSSLSDEGDHRPNYVVSQDIDILMARWALERGFVCPGKEVFNALRRNMKAKLAGMFPEYRIVFLKAEDIVGEFDALIAERQIPTISLDRIYTNRGFYLHWTRIVNEELNFIGNGSRTKETLQSQLDRITPQLPSNISVQLVDDVIYSGDNLVDLIGLLNENGVTVGRVVGAISIGAGVENIIEKCSGKNPNLQVDSLIRLDNVVDEVCERDFYPGVPQSGRLVGSMVDSHPVPITPETGAPYLLPFGDPEKWASVPSSMIMDWSRFCIYQTIDLWKTVQLVSSRVVLYRDLDRRPLAWNNDSVPFITELKNQAVSF